MKLNAILPFLIPVLIAGGLIGYNEMNDNVLLEMLKNNSTQIQNIKEENQGIKVNELNTNQISNTTNYYSNSELAEGFVLSEIPADAQCQIGLNNNYIVCTSLSELMDYFRNVPINPQELQYKNHTQIEYYPFPDREINKIPNRFGSTASAGGQGNYKELRKSLRDASVGYFDIDFEEKNVNSNTNSDINETDVSDKIEESLLEISNIVEKADFILDKVNYVRTLNDPEDINITKEDYNTFISNYKYLINKSSTISQLKINETDLKKIQDAASYAPIVISLIENNFEDNTINNPKTVTLENTDVTLVTETQVTLTNNNHDIKVNDIIVAGVLDNAPLGFLRKVTNISQDNGKYLLQTEKASLSDAYANEIANPVQESDTANSNNSYTFQPTDAEDSQNQDSEFITELIESDATIAQKSYNCGSKGCFEASFKNCTSAIGIDEILEPYSQKTQYEIVGMGQKDCKVKTTFEVSFFKDWEGKSITCELDNSLSITEAAGLIYQPNGSSNLNCEGELLPELKKYGY